MSKAFLTLGDGALQIDGVSELVSVYDKEVVIKRSEQRIVITGQGIAVSRLELEQGIASFTYTTLAAISFGIKKKFSFSSLFK